MNSLETLPRVRLTFLPTPVHRMENLGRSIGLRELWIKRDDLTGVEFGGNKTRKLEFVVADALKKGCDILVTVGAVQSNSCRQTAAAAARHGLRCLLLLAGPEPQQYQGNLLLDALMGAELKFFPEETFMTLTERLPVILETLEELGLRPYAIPAGVFTPLGSMGYVMAMYELKRQLDELHISLEKIVMTSSTGGTLAGMAVGAHLAGIDAEIVSFCVFDNAEVTHARVKSMISRMAQEYPELGINTELNNFTVDDRFLGAGYGIVDDGVKTAIDMFAKMEGIILDPVYTARSALGLIRMALQNEIESDTPILYWHTGGQPALFAHDHFNILE